jgi:hypothetical protein
VKKLWPGARLPECGESSYLLVLKGASRDFNKRYPKHPIRRTSRATKPDRACLRRYYLIQGNSKANKTGWSYPPGQLIRPNPKIVYSIPEFASFFDATEASLYANVFKAYLGKSVKVVQEFRG